MHKAVIEKRFSEGLAFFRTFETVPELGLDPW
jgi:hypothetical protein